MELAEKELGIPVVEREVGRTELYAADEVFLSGTGFQIAPVTEVDDRPIGTGSIGPVAERLQELYFKAARGGWDAYADWTVAVEVAEGARR
jgi:branched-chain amino acid aminotransferase